MRVLDAAKMAQSRKRVGEDQDAVRGKKKKRTVSGSGDHVQQNVLTAAFRDGSVMCEILTKAGMIIKTLNMPNEICKDQAVFQKDLMAEFKRHPDYPQVIEEFVEDLVKFIEKPNRLRWSLTPCVVPANCDASSAGGTQDSMMRLLLGLEKLQPLVVNVLLEKLAEFTGDEGCHIGDDEVNIPKLIMNQFRWLDKIVNGQVLVEKLFEVLSITPLEIQREMITSLPEVVDDLQHTEVAKQLKELLIGNSQLAVPILDALTNLSLHQDLLSVVRGSVVHTLPSAELEDLPIIVKFLFQTVGGSEDALEIVSEMRQNLDFESGVKTKSDKMNKGSERSTECLIMDAIKSAVRFQRSVAEAWIKAIDTTKIPTEHKVLDLCVLFILHSCNYKKPVESLLRNKVRAGHFSEVLLGTTFKSYAEVLRDYFPSVLSVSEVLLRSPEPTVSYFACCMYKKAFHSFDSFCQQEIVGNLVTHIGSGFSSETDSSLHILDDLVESNILKMVPFTLLVKSVLDYLDNLTITQIRRLYSMLSALAFKNPRDEGMIQDEMHIIIRKQLSSSKSKYKRMGVIGAIMVVKSLAQDSSSENLEQASDGADTTISSSAYKQVINLLQLVRASSSKSPDIVALFMDELSAIIAKGIIDPRVESWISDNVINDFQDDFVVDIDPEKREGNVVLPMRLQMGLDDESEGAIAINLLPLLLENREKLQQHSHSQERKISPLFLSPNFRLLQICEKRQNGSDLEGIDALLGCPVYLPKKEVLDKFPSLSNIEKEIFCEATFLCINWYREIINAFATQKDPEMKAKVITRLQNITDLITILKEALPATTNLIPPPACFDTEESGKPVISTGTTAGTSGAIRGKTPTGKRKKKEGNREIDTQVENLDETSKDSTQDVTRQGSQGGTQSKGSGKSDEGSDKSDVNLSRYRHYFRELDLEVFDILKVGLITKAALDTELNTKDTSTLQIQPPQLQFLLEDLKMKLEHALPVGAAKKKMFLKSKSEKHLGFSNLDQLSSIHVVSKAVEWLPALCDHLEGTNAYFQALIASNDGVVDGPGHTSPEAQLMADCFHLVLQCFLTVFSWTGFSLPEHRTLLKDGLSVLASRMNSNTTSQLPMQELLKQSFQYLENFSGTVPQLPCAVTLCKLVSSIVQRGTVDQFQTKLGTICQGFLKQEWLGPDGERAKGARHNEHLHALLKLYFMHSEDKLLAIENIASVGIPELLEADKNGSSTTYPTLTKNSYTTYYRCLLSELVECCKAIRVGKQTENNEAKMEKILRWNMAVRIFHIMVNLIKAFDARANLTAVLKYGRMLVETFLKQAMPLIDVMFRNYKDEVLGLLKNLQISTRALHHMCGHSKIIKDVSLTNQVPLVKKCLETFVYRVKACLTMNSCLEAFWLGNLKNRDLQGEEIVQISQTSSIATDSTAGDESDGSLPADSETDSEVEVDKESSGNGDPEDQSYSETY